MQTTMFAQETGANMKHRISYYTKDKSYIILLMLTKSFGHVWVNYNLFISYAHCVDFPGKMKIRIPKLKMCSYTS